MAPLFEAVPNVSEGRRPGVIAALAEAVRAGDAALLDVSADPDHNRTVLTLAGSAEGLIAALLHLYSAALGAIDLRRQRGVHPRLGAVDVVPFVPLADATMGGAVAAARRLGDLVASRFSLPVYFYEQAARDPARRSLPDVRRGQFEGLAEKMARPEWQPDLGPPGPHERAGATIIGARRLLVAFNVVLRSRDLGLARSIAGSIRTASGGLPAVRAMGVELDSRGAVQVSVNLLDCARTPPVAAYDAIASRAAAAGVEVIESEIVGLAPRAALPEHAAQRLRLREPGTRVLEDRLHAAGLLAANATLPLG